MLCHNCGTLLQAGARFCSNCGERTVAVRPGSRGTEPPGRLKTALTEPWEGLDGATLSAEKKLVSVLFADIVGSTQVVSRHDPETALHFLDSIMSIFERDVTYFGGVVIRLLGDGILALFGAPKADENHARHACLAALRIQASVKTSAGFPLGEALEPASVRIGISTGEVILRSQKAGQATEHLVTGLSAHLSARLQQAADKGSIFCDNATRMLSKPENFLWHSRGAMAFRGFADPVDVQELLSTVGVQARVGATLGTPGVAFVGRHAAMAEARRFILARGDRQARAMLISGEAGIGKTRFCRELLRRSEGWSEPRGAAPVEDARLKSVRVECTSYGQHTPLAPFAAIVRAHLDRLGASSDQEIRAALDARAPGLAMGPVADVPDAGGGGVGVATALRPQDFALGIRAVLGMELRDPAWTALDASQRRLIVFDSVTRVISAMADGSNIFVIENVHWIDDESRELLDHLLAVCAGETVFILTSRETPELPAGHQGRVLHVALEELDRHEALDLIGRCLDENASRASAEAVHQRTGGNPFFIIEYVKELTERRLQPAAGEVEAGAGGTPDGVRLPATLRALLGARIDARQPGEKRLIRLCAVAGGELPAEIVSACLPDLTGSEIEALVGRLTQEGYLRERDMGGTIVYRLAVSMLQDVVLSSLLTTQRRHLHERILRAMEAVHGGAVQSNTEVAAYHAKMSDSTEEAIRYSWEAGRRAIDRSAYHVATRFLEDALRFCLAKPAGPGQAAEAIDICFDLRRSYFPIGRIPKDLENLEYLEQSVAGHADTGRQARLAAYVARDLAQLGRPDESLAACERAQQLARDAGLRELEVLTEGYIAAAHFVLGDFATAAASLGGAKRALDGFPREATLGLPAPAYLFFEAWGLWALARLGEREEGAAASARLLDFAGAQDQPLTEAVALYSVGFFEIHCGRFEAASTLLTRGIGICEQWDLVAWFTNLSMSLGYAELGAGRAQAGRAHLLAAVERSRELGIMVSHALEVAWLAEAHLACGETEKALKTARQALAIAERYRERGNRAEALFVLAKVLAEMGGAEEECEAVIAEARVLARDCGMRPLLAKSEALRCDQPCPRV